MADQRTNPRYDVVVPIRFRDADDFLVQYTENISSGGVFIRTENPPEKGTELRLSLELPGTKTALPVTGVVAFVVTPAAATQSATSAGCGVRFQEMDPATVRVLESFVENVQKRARGNILIVDDDAQVLDLLAQVLRTARFNVVTALSATKALDLMSFNDFDLILCDLQMSRMDGFEFRDNLRQNEELADIPFILMTGSEVNKEDVQVAKSLGVHEFLGKPIDHKKLVQLIMNGIIGRGRSEKSPTVRPQRQRARKVSEIAFRKMQALGFQSEFTADESAVLGRMRFKHVALTNTVTGDQIFDARVRSVGHDRVRFVEPKHLSNLLPIPILDLGDAKAFESAVKRAYKGRLQWIELGRRILLRWGIPDEVSESGFCVLGRVKVGGDTVIVSVRDDHTLAVEAVNGRPLTELASPSQCIVDIRDCESGLEVEIAVENVIGQLRNALTPVPQPAEPDAPQQEVWLGDMAPEPQPEPEPEPEPAELDVSELEPLDLEPVEPAPATPATHTPPPPPPVDLGAPPPPPVLAAPVFVETDATAEDVADLFGSMEELVGEQAEDDDGVLSLLDEDDLDLLD